jgi:hypothetical protein
MFYLDYLLYTTIIILLCILIYKELNTKENFEHRGKEEMADNKSSTKEPPSIDLFDLIYRIINIIYKFLLVFSRIVTTPFQIINKIGDSFTSTFNELNNLFIKMTALLTKLSYWIKDHYSDILNTYGLDNGLDNILYY